MRINLAALRQITISKLLHTICLYSALEPAMPRWGWQCHCQLSGNFVGQGIISGINTNSAGAGVYGRSNLTNSGGEFSAGVYGENIGGGNGVYGVSNSNNDGFGGVFGQATNGDGVIGSGGRSGVFGFSTAGNGVTGNSGSTSFAGVSGFNGNTVLEYGFRG